MSKGTTKRLGKKHRKAATRPHQGPTPKAAKAAGGKLAISSPKARKAAAKQAAVRAREALKTKQSPDFEGKRSVGGPRMPRAGSREESQAKSRQQVHEEARARVNISSWSDTETERAVRDNMPLIEDVTRSAEAVNAPLFAICGRPNVGKSTLFNRLTGTRRSIVGDEPGITRDRIYGEVEWDGKFARIVDTGGVIPDDEALIPTEIYRQARVALEEAEAVVMVVDGRTELASPDVDLARILLRSGKPVFLAVNKMDTAAITPQAENFRQLGFKELYPISAEHNNGIGDLLDAVFGALKFDDNAGSNAELEAIHENEAEVEEEFDTDDSPRERRLKSHGEHVARETKVAIIGRPNVGKSTLLNALTGKTRSIVSPIAGTTRDAVDEVVTRNNHDFRFIDTAGIRRKGKTTLMAEKLSVIMARKHLEDADVALLVIDATEGVAALDANIGGYAHESGRSVVIVVNKWDAVTTNREEGTPEANIKVYTEQVRHALKYLDYAPLVFISAMEGKNINAVFREVQRVARERRKRVTTGNMNRFLNDVDFQRASVPMNKRVKIYFITQAAVAPPTFVLFTDRDVKLHFAFERFLENQLREAFGFSGTPIWFKVKARNKKKDDE